MIIVSVFATCRSQEVKHIREFLLWLKNPNRILQQHQSLEVDYTNKCCGIEATMSDAGDSGVV